MAMERPIKHLGNGSLTDVLTVTRMVEGATTEYNIAPGEGIEVPYTDEEMVQLAIDADAPADPPVPES